MMKSNRTARGIVIASGAVILMILFVWKNIVARDIAAELEQVRSQNSELLYERDQLRAEVVTLSAVSRIKHVASEKLGLVDPQEAPVDVPSVAPLD